MLDFFPELGRDASGREGGDAKAPRQQAVDSHCRLRVLVTVSVPCVATGG